MLPLCFFVTSSRCEITDSSTWLWTSQLESCSFRQLQPLVCPILELDPEWWLCTSPTPGGIRKRTLPLGPEGELPPEARKSWGWRGGAGGGGGDLSTHWGSAHHSLNLTDVFCLSWPPPSFYAPSLARHLPCASKSIPATILPAITLNSFLAFWDFACFPPLVHPISLVGCFHSVFF